MPWTVENPPEPMKGNKDKMAVARCVLAANQAKKNGENDEACIAACMRAAHMSESSEPDWSYFGDAGSINGGPFCVLPVGNFERDGRKIVITAADIEEMVRNFEAGVPDRDIPVNVEHERVRGRFGRIAKLEARKDGAYAIIDWDARGREVLDAQMFRYFSPEIAWAFQTATGETRKNVIMGLALTNYPFFGKRLSLFSDGRIEEAAQDELTQQVAELEAVSTPDAGAWDKLIGVVKALFATRQAEEFAAPTKTDGGQTYPAAAFLVREDDAKPSTWHLRIWEDPDKKVTVAQLGRAAAALGPGFRGQKYEGPDAGKAKAALVALYRKMGVDDDAIPKYLFSEDATGGVERSIESMAEDVEQAVAQDAPDEEKKDEAVTPELAEEPTPAADAAAPDEQAEAPAPVEAASETPAVDEMAEMRSRLEAAEAKAAEVQAYAEKLAALESKLGEVEKMAEAEREKAEQEREQRRLMEFTDKAEHDYSALPGKPDELGAFLKWAFDSDASDDKTHYGYLTAKLAEANEAFTHTYREVGTSRTPDSDGTSDFERAVEQRAAQLRQGGKSKYDAYAEALRAVGVERPELAAAYVAQRQEETAGQSWSGFDTGAGE